MLPAIGAPDGSAAATASARARDVANARAIKAAQEELNAKMTEGHVRLVLTVINKMRPSPTAAVARLVKPRDRTHEKSTLEREKARAEKQALKLAAEAAERAAVAERATQQAMELALAMQAASSFVPPAPAAEPTAFLPAGYQMPDVAPSAYATPPSAHANQWPSAGLQDVPMPPPLLCNPAFAAQAFTQPPQAGMPMMLPGITVDGVRALHQGALEKGVADQLYSEFSLHAVPPFRLASNGQEMMAPWVAATMQRPQLPPLPPPLPSLAPAVVPVEFQPPPHYAPPLYAVPPRQFSYEESVALTKESVALSRIRFMQSLHASIPQPSPHLLRGLVPEVATTHADMEVDPALHIRRMESSHPGREAQPSPPPLAGPVSPPLQLGATPKAEFAAGTPASPPSPMRRKLRPPPPVRDEYVRVRLIVTEKGRVSMDAAHAEPALRAADAGLKRPRARHLEAGAVAKAIAPPLLLEIAARRAAPSEQAASAVMLRLTEAKNACADPLCHTQPTLWADVGTNPPAALLRGSDPAFWGALRGQGALMVRASGTWDPAAKKSTLMDVSWLTGGGTKLRTVASEYQYIRQTLPASNGFVEVYEDYLPPDSLNGDYPFGALVEDIQESFRFAAESFRLLGVPDRERYFLAQMRLGLRLQFPYLQGVALNALNGRGAMGCLRATPPAGAHAWDPSGLPVCEGSILPSLLRQCEACCNPLLNAGGAPAAAEGAAAAAAPDAQPSSPPRPPRNMQADRAAEVEATGAAAPGRDAAAFAHQLQRRLAGQSAIRPPNSRRSRNGAPSKKRVKDFGAAAAAEADHDAAAGEAPAAAAPQGPSAAEAAAVASMSKLWGAGIVTPWLYFMGVCSTFAAHFEDYAFGSANVIVAPPDTQAWVIWYSVPRESLAVFHAFLRDLLKEEYTLDCLEGRRLWIDPRLVAEWNARQPAGSPTCPVYRHVQGPGDYVVTDYGSVHWGVNLGVGWKAAVNFAFEDWRPAAEQVHAVYAQLERETGQQRHYRCAPDFGGERCAGAFDDGKLASFALRREDAAGDAPPLPHLPPLAEREAAAAAAFAAAVAAAKEGLLNPTPVQPPAARAPKAPRTSMQHKTAVEPQPQPPAAALSPMPPPAPPPASPPASPPPPAPSAVLPAAAELHLPSPSPRPASPEAQAEPLPPPAARLLTPDMAPLAEYEAAAPAAAALFLVPERETSYQVESKRAVTPDLPSLDVAERSLSGARR